MSIAGQDFAQLYMGIDAPEADGYLAAEATDANRTLVAGKTVSLERDASETDCYGRLLRYVYIGDCSPCFPWVCLPPPRPDLDCAKIDECRSRVVGCDPHGLDGDKDGMGCERYP